MSKPATQNSIQSSARSSAKGVVLYHTYEGRPVFKPRANPPPIKALDLLGVNLHQADEPSRTVEDSDVSMMR